MIGQKKTKSKRNMRERTKNWFSEKEFDIIQLHGIVSYLYEKRI